MLIALNAEISRSMPSRSLNKGARLLFPTMTPGGAVDGVDPEPEPDSELESCVNNDAFG